MRQNEILTNRREEIRFILNNLMQWDEITKKEMIRIIILIKKD